MEIEIQRTADGEPDFERAARVASILAETAEFYRVVLDRGVDDLLVSRPEVAVGVVAG